MKNRLPTSRIEELPQFTSAHTTLPAIQHLATILHQQSNTTTDQVDIEDNDDVLHVLTFVPALRPPTRAATEHWLQEERDFLASQEGVLRPFGTVAWAMDANTGKLLPAGGLEVGLLVFI